MPFLDFNTSLMVAVFAVTQAANNDFSSVVTSYKADSEDPNLQAAVLPIPLSDFVSDDAPDKAIADFFTNIRSQAVTLLGSDFDGTQLPDPITNSLSLTSTFSDFAALLRQTFPRTANQ